MPRFFVDSGPDVDGLLTITGDDARHIALSLRCAVGDMLEVCSGGTVYECRLDYVRPEKVTLGVVSEREDRSELPCRVTLYIANPKGQKLDFVIEKCTELGASAIMPFLSERCVSRPDGGAFGKRLARCRRIAYEAAKQCGRGLAPTVGEMRDFKTAVEEASKADVPLFIYENENERTLRDAVKGKLGRGASVSAMIGAEGGFSPEEAALASEAGLTACGLGPRILRCETAPLYVMSALSYEAEL